MVAVRILVILLHFGHIFLTSTVLLKHCSETVDVKKCQREVKNAKRMSKYD